VRGIKAACLCDIHVMQEYWSACMSPLAATRSLPLSGLINYA